MKESKAKDEKKAKEDKARFQILTEASKAEVIFNLAINFPSNPIESEKARRNLNTRRPINSRMTRPNFYLLESVRNETIGSR